MKGTVPTPTYRACLFRVWDEKGQKYYGAHIQILSISMVELLLLFPRQYAQCIGFSYKIMLSCYCWVLGKSFWELWFWLQYVLTGELLTTKEARRRQQEYDQLSESGHLAHFSSALLVVREHLPSRKACLRLNIDATRIGNVARFINHSCDGGNLSTVLIRSTGSLLPRLCFFASRDIGQDEELSFSYGEARLRPESEGSPCFCGASSCSGTLPSEHTWRKSLTRAWRPRECFPT